jgi:hypothetical protein
MEDEILDVVERESAARTDTFEVSVHHTLQKLYPYHVQTLQASALHGVLAGLASINLFEDPNFRAKGELCFAVTATTNIHNKRVWSDGKSCAARSYHQRQFSINLWAGILGDAS